MQFKSVSSHLALSLSALALITQSGCATNSVSSSETPKRKPTISRAIFAKNVNGKRVRKTKTRDPLVRSEIRAELLGMNAETQDDVGIELGTLKGPITMKRIAEIELEQKMRETASIAADGTSPATAETKVADLKGGVLETLLAKNDSATAKAATLARAGVDKSEDAAHLAASEKLKALIAASPEPGVIPSSALAPVTAPEGKTVIAAEPPVALKTLTSLENSKMEFSNTNETPFIFDIPVTYNERVSGWIHYFQTKGRRSFRTWLERSARYLPVVEAELQRAGLPQDLVYVAMIESGFRPDAVSHAGAMGMWQFIASTGRRYGLSIDWWVDERRDFAKSTKAAISYMKDLNGQFNSWYLVAASYNMGENGVRRLMKRHNTNDFWTLADRRALPSETTDYVPKIIAATLIAKAPALYGFRDLEYHTPMTFEMFRVPGGTDLMNLAAFLGISGKYMQELNPELLRGFIPREVNGHNIRIPKGSGLVVSQFLRLQQSAPRRESAANEYQ